MKMRSMIAAAALVLLPAALLRADGQTIPTDKQKKPPKKVLTEDDIRGGSAGRGTVSTGTPDAPAADAAKEGEAKKDGTAAAAKEEPSESDKRETRRKEIQDEIDFQTANIKVLQDQINAAQAELNDLTDMTYSAPGTTTGPRAGLMKKIDDANAQIKTSQETIDRLEDEARRAGIAIRRQ